MIPPKEAMRAGTLQAEKMAHENGWDAPPSLLMLAATDMGGMLALAATEVPFAESIPDGNPAVYLRLLGKEMGRGGRMEHFAAAMAKPDFCGATFVCEGWMHPFTSDEEREKETRRFADIPGSLEVRSVITVDTAGRVGWAQRVRGRKPEFHFGGEETVSVGGGRVPGGLRAIVLGIAMHMPFGTADLDALRGLKFENEDG